MQLENCFKVLCSDSTDLLEAKQKIEQTNKELEIQRQKRAQAQDDYLCLQMKMTELLTIERRFHTERKLKHDAEEHLAVQIKENDTLRQTIKTLQDELAKK